MKRFGMCIMGFICATHRKCYRHLYSLLLRLPLLFLLDPRKSIYLDHICISTPSYVNELEKRVLIDAIRYNNHYLVLDKIWHRVMKEIPNVDSICTPVVQGYFS